MANSSISVTEGSGKNIATYSFSESTTKELQRISLNNSSGTEIGTNSNPVQIGDAGGSLTVDNGGTFAVQAVGNVAHASADSGAPVKGGGRARSSEITAVSNDSRVDSIHDLVGKQIVLPYANPENFVSGLTAAMTGTTSTSLLAAPAAGLRNYITHVLISNSHATVGTFVTLQDGSGGTALYTGYAAAVGGGFSITFPTPLRQPTTATALFVVNVTTGANVIASASGYKGA